MFRTVISMAALLLAAAAAAQEKPQFTFGVLTDIQYADQATAGKREYRASVEKLRQAVEALNAARPEFVIQLGDLVDGGAANVERILPLFQKLEARQYHVLGNHDSCMPLERLLKRLGMPGAWYDFGVAGWRFVVLHGMEVSVAYPERAPQTGTARQMLAALRERKAANAQEWDGAAGEAQRAWLRGVLGKARQTGERAIVFCHHPALRESSTPAHLLWDHEEVVRVLDEFPNVAAYMNGHDHNGGYAVRQGVHFVTFPGMVESGAATSYTLVDVFRDRLELRGTGSAPSRTLPLR